MLSIYIYLSLEILSSNQELIALLHHPCYGLSRAVQQPTNIAVALIDRHAASSSHVTSHSSYHDATGSHSTESVDNLAQLNENRLTANQANRYSLNQPDNKSLLRNFFRTNSVGDVSKSPVRKSHSEQSTDRVSSEKREQFLTQHKLHRTIDACDDSLPDAVAPCDQVSASNYHGRDGSGESQLRKNFALHGDVIGISVIFTREIL